MKNPIGITLGDPAGIGPEIIVKALTKISYRNLVLIGSRAVLNQQAGRLGIRLPPLLIYDTGAPGRFEYGQVQKNCGIAALQALECGVNLLKANRLAALVTAPVSKAALRLAGFKYPGQTELLAARLRARRYAMLAWSKKFKVIFVTIHLPLAQVPRQIKPGPVLEKIYLLNQFLIQEGNPAPKIGVFALNPHADEFSRGEENFIRQAIRQARQKGIIVNGPLPADSVFACRTQFHGFVAMYHDQAMIPAKLLAKDAGVNVTLGLGKIRTSPLHGVAFDIAGQGKAAPDSMIAAIRLAKKLARTI
jgi:4-hydroxythreonine-4-phosphate dehydrogenase|uniref:4-hydroxythreonine-4-phosphate dehydrogenase PdxA n=1 Tax=candidate division WOR-3 bacterium TaxID=2052148 RepID=A0A7V3V017_UNCW3